MPLSAPVEREEIHQRRYAFAGYRRADGLWDIEGSLLDTKSYPFENRTRGTVTPGEPVHHMVVRLCVDDDFVIREVEVATDAGPFEACPGIAPNYRKLEGQKLGPGWRRALRALVGGTEGCTHITEMLGAMATVAFQTMYPVLINEGKVRSTPGQRPALIDSCHALRADGPVARLEWPEHYTGSEAQGADSPHDERR